MKLIKIFRFELFYQARRPATWVCFVALCLVAYLFVRGNFLADAMYADFFINSPFVISVVTVFGCLFWLLVAGIVTGEVAARDWDTGMHPLSHTASVTRADYLGGRFLAAFAIHLAILFAIPLGIILSVYLPGVESQFIGPFRVEAYLTAFCYIVLPNAFIGTAIQFSFATLGRRVLASYLGSLLLFVVVYGGIFLIFYFGGRKEVAAMLDAFAQISILDKTMSWTPAQKSTRMLTMEGYLLWSRLIWLGIAITVLAFTYLRFRFTHHTAKQRCRLSLRKRASQRISKAATAIAEDRIPVPDVPRTFGLATYLRQTLAIAGTSFRTLAMSLAGLPILGVIALLTVIIVPGQMYNIGTPLLPRTNYLLTFLTTPLTSYFTPWVIIPLLIVLYSGELVWRERKAGLGEISDAVPVPEWGVFLGKYLGLSLMLVLLIVLLLFAGLAIQLRMGYYDFEIGLYLKVLFGLQLPEYLLFALLALILQGLIRQRYLGHMITLLVYAAIIFAAILGINHHMLVYGSGPGWKYDDMRGFGTSIGPWLWFRLYWTAWALLLVVTATLFWIRGMEGSVKARLREARIRFTRTTAGVSFIAVTLILLIGGFIFYNTNVLNGYTSTSRMQKLRAEYEMRYARFRDVPQPELTATKLRVALFPQQRKADINGVLQLINHTTSPIDSIHLATIRHVRTGVITFNRAASLAIMDDAHGHRTYALRQPLLPGDSIQLSFDVHIEPSGFGNNGIQSTVAANGTYLRTQEWLPAIGYQVSRELLKPGERRTYGLASRPLTAALESVDAGDISGDDNHDMSPAGRKSFVAIVSTDADQTAIAPGVLQRTWTKDGRRFFEYASEAPVGDDYAFFSARYALRKEQWRPTAVQDHAVLGDTVQNVAIEIYHHPTHSANVSRLLRSVRASLANYSREFGRYPYSYIRLIENPVRGIGAHAEPATIDYGQGFALFNPADDPKGLDFPFAIIAHEVAHQWWGAQLSYAFVEGAGLLTESPAWYSAINVIEETYGREHMHRLMRFFRQPYPIPPIRQSVPLLQGKDPYAAYRKGPFALHCLREYMGKDRVNLAYRRLIEKQNAGLLGPATSLDLYRELQIVTPDSLQYLLHDLFEANTFWELKTKQVSAKQLNGGSWQVTLELQTRKVVVDPAGNETVIPMDEWMEIGVFAPTGSGSDFGKTLYLRKHRIHSGQQTITLTVPTRPADAGVDPCHLLIDTEPFDNVEKVKIE
jgi:ABC-type transport system involved in multi-copper enzyme maturation permease subunit